jgi:hypothetical protein
MQRDSNTDHSNPFGSGCFDYGLIERRQRATLTHGQFKIGGVVERKPMAVCERENCCCFRKGGKPDDHIFETRQKRRHLALSDPVASHAKQDGIADLEPKKEWCNDVGFFLQQCEGSIGARVFLIAEAPARGYRRIDNEPH